MGLESVTLAVVCLIDARLDELRADPAWGRARQWGPTPIVAGRCVMSRRPTIRIVLLPDGRVAMPKSGRVDTRGEATWERLGSILECGEPMVFVRAEIDGASWASLVPRSRLERAGVRPVVTLRRQTEPHPPLAGWSRFC